MRESSWVEQLNSAEAIFKTLPLKVYWSNKNCKVLVSDDYRSYTLEIQCNTYRLMINFSISKGQSLCLNYRGGYHYKKTLNDDAYYLCSVKVNSTKQDLFFNVFNEIIEKIKDTEQYKCLVDVLTEWIVTGIKIPNNYRRHLWEQVS